MKLLDYFRVFVVCVWSRDVFLLGGSGFFVRVGFGLEVFVMGGRLGVGLGWMIWFGWG